MDSLRTHCAPLKRLNFRPGMIAIQEVIFIVLLLIGLMWLMHRFVAIPPHASNAAIMAKNRYVSRIRLDSQGRHVSLLRPREGCFSMDLLTHAMERSFPCSFGEMIALDFSGDGSTVLICGIDGTVVMYHDLDEVGISCTKLESDTDVHAIVANEGEFAACVASNGQVDGWRRQGSEFAGFRFELGSDPPIHFVFANSTGSRLCVVRRGGSVSFHRSTTGDLDGPTFNVGSTNVAVDWSCDEHSIVAVTDSSLVHVFDVDTGGVVREFSLVSQPHACDFAVVRISPDGKWIAVSTKTLMEIRILNVTTGTTTRKLSGHTATVRAMQFSPGSDRLYSGSYDGTLREWSLETHSQSRILD